MTGSTSPNNEQDLKLLRRWWHVATTTGVMAALASCAMAIWEHDCKIGKYVVAFTWCLAPPLWFIFERQFLIKWYGNDLNITEFRDSADLASKLWAGVAALLIFLYAEPTVARTPLLGAHPCWTPDIALAHPPTPKAPRAQALRASPLPTPNSLQPPKPP
jgi:hypothetical protein